MKSQTYELQIPVEFDFSTDHLLKRQTLISSTFSMKFNISWFSVFKKQFNHQRVRELEVGFQSDNWSFLSLLQKEQLTITFD